MRLSTARKLKVGDRVRYGPGRRGVQMVIHVNAMAITLESGGRYYFGDGEGVFVPFAKVPPRKPMSDELKAKLRESAGKTRLKDIGPAEVCMALDHASEKTGLDIAAKPTRDDAQAYVRFAPALDELLAERLAHDWACLSCRPSQAHPDGWRKARLYNARLLEEVMRFLRLDPATKCRRVRQPRSKG